MMTDTYPEWWTQKEPVEEACRRGGRVLVTGLGLGVIVESMLRTPGSRVRHITVVEASSDVIRLIGPHLGARYGDRLEIVHASAFDWTPPKGSHYDVIWHDIWPSPYEPGNLPEMERLEEIYGRYCDWQGFWGRDMIVEAGAS